MISLLMVFQRDCLGVLIEENCGEGRREELRSDFTNDKIPWLMILVLDVEGIVHATCRRRCRGVRLRQQQQ